MAVCVLQRLSKIAKATQVARTPQTRQAKVEGLGVTSKPRRDACVAVYAQACEVETSFAMQLLVSDAGDAAWNYCGK